MDIIIKHFLPEASDGNIVNKILSETTSSLFKKYLISKIKSSQKYIYALNFFLKEAICSRPNTISRIGRYVEYI